MKKLFAVFLMTSTLAFAEASFDQIEGLIRQRNYPAAVQGLEVVIQNHPNSAKAFFAMAQAQAGLGNLDRAQRALDRATGLNPSLDFASSSTVQSLREAIAPQTHKIEAIEQTHYLRNLFLFLLITGAALWLWRNRRPRSGDGNNSSSSDPNPVFPSSSQSTAGPVLSGSVIMHTQTAQNHQNRSYYQPSVQLAPVIVNNNSNDGLLTGLMIGNILGGSHHHHDRETIRDREVVREVVREVPPTGFVHGSGSTWGNDSSSSSSGSSSSWDDSSGTSSSWDSSSSGSSSSWDSGSSGSSWDSGSSGSDSSSSWE